MRGAWRARLEMSNIGSTRSTAIGLGSYLLLGSMSFQGFPLLFMGVDYCI